MSFYILSSWLTVLSGDFSPGLHHHPFLSIQHPQYKFCDLHSILSHWEVQFQSIHMLPRIPHQESKTSLNFSLIHTWQFFMNFFLFLFNKWLPLHLNICLYVQKKCGADSEWMRGPPGSCNQDPSLWPQCNLNFWILAPLQKSQALMCTACSLALLI